MSDPDRDPVEELAEEFLARLRKGERPSVTEYAARVPDRSAEIEDLFRTMLLMERWKQKESDASRSSSGTETAGPPMPERIGDFRVLGELGRGGMGIVYEAEQVSLGRPVALKVLPAGSFLTPRKVERFQREAKAAAGLHHTNIVQVYGAGEEGGLHYYVMQRIEGRSLDAVLLEAGSLEPTRAARVALDVARALSYAHGRGVLHRDVKPANLILDGAGTVWVTDFGLAKFLSGEEDLTRTGDLVGTLRYMAPERFEGRSDARSDLYALGLVLYEMICGRPAFDASDPKALAVRVKGAEPTPPRRIDPSIPRDLETIVLRAAAREPEHRYATATALAEDLARYLEDRPILARRAGPGERIVRWCRRNRALAVLSGVAAASLLLAAAAGWTGYLTARRSLAREEENVRLSLDSLEEIFDAVSPRERRGGGPGARRGPGGPPGPEERENAEAAVLESIVSFYDRFAEQNETNPRLKLEAARAHRRIAALRDRMGQREEAEKALDRALSAYESLAAEYPGDKGILRQLEEVRTARKTGRIGPPPRAR